MFLLQNGLSSGRFVLIVIGQGSRRILGKHLNSITSQSRSDNSIFSVTRNECLFPQNPVVQIIGPFITAAFSVLSKCSMLMLYIKLVKIADLCLYFKLWAFICGSFVYVYIPKLLTSCWVLLCVSYYFSKIHNIFQSC